MRSPTTSTALDDVVPPARRSSISPQMSNIEDTFFRMISILTLSSASAPALSLAHVRRLQTATSPRRAYLVALDRLVNDPRTTERARVCFPAAIYGCKRSRAVDARALRVRGSRWHLGSRRRSASAPAADEGTRRTGKTSPLFDFRSWAPLGRAGTVSFRPRRSSIHRHEISQGQASLRVGGCGCQAIAGSGARDRAISRQLHHADEKPGPM